MNLLNLQLMLCLLMGVGAFLRKTNIIKKEGKDVLTDLVIYVILPCNIVNSFCIEFNTEILKAGLVTLCISIGIQVGCTLISAFCYNRIPKRQRVILQYGTVCSNAGILGNPLAEGIYGPLGLLYASIYCIPQRIVMWSAGISYFTGAPSKKKLVIKVLTHPCVVAVIIGIFMMLTGFRFPTFIARSITSIGICITAISMIFIGAELADCGMKQMLSKITVLYSVIRLFIIPTLVLLGCMALRVDPLAGSVCVLLAAMPMGSTTAILAAKYDGDVEYATKCTFLTTLLSMLFLPAWCMVLQTVLA